VTRRPSKPSPIKNTGRPSIAMLQSLGRTRQGTLGSEVIFVRMYGSTLEKVKRAAPRKADRPEVLRRLVDKFLP